MFNKYKQGGLLLTAILVGLLLLPTQNSNAQCFAGTSAGVGNMPDPSACGTSIKSGVGPGTYVNTDALHNGLNYRAYSIGGGFTGYVTVSSSCGHLGSGNGVNFTACGTYHKLSLHSNSSCGLVFPGGYGSASMYLRENTPGTASGVSGGGTICSGGSRTLTHSNNAGSGYTYYWQTSTGGTSTSVSSSSYSVSPGSTTTYYVRRRSVNGCWGAAGGGTTVTVVSDPSTPSVSGGGVTICSGGSRTLTASSSGGLSCSWEWQRSTNNSTWYAVGPNSSSYNTGVITTSYYYRVRRICNGSGCSDPYSGSTLITVAPDPSISSSGGGTICVGGSRTLSASVSGGTGSCSYQWQRSSDNSSFGNISGATSSTYNTGALSATRYYRVVRSCNGNGCNTATSNTQTVTVVSDPSIIASGQTTVCSGGSATITSSTSGGVSCSYQWQSSPNNSTWTNIGGATGSSYAASGLTSTTYYRVLRNCNGSGCSDPASNSVKITVKADPSASISGGTTICTGGNRTLSSSASGGVGSFSYQWQRSSGTTCSGFSNDGGNSPSYNTGALTATRCYRCIVTQSGNGCSTVTTNTQTVTVATDPSISLATNRTNVCTGGNADLTATTSGGAGSCSFQWQRAINAGGFANIGGTASTLNTGSLGGTDTRRYRVQRICSASGCGTATSNEVSITVTPDPSITVSPTAHEMCPGQSLTLTTSPSNGVSCSIQWQRSTTGSGSANFSNIAGATGTSYNTGALTANPDYYYRTMYTCSGSGCSSPVFSNKTRVIVRDIEDPVVACKNITVQLNSLGAASISTGDVYQSGSDNCGTVNQQSVSPSSFTCSNVGGNNVTLTVNDGNGNTKTCVSVVTIQDNVNPIAICKNTTVQLNSSGSGTITTGDVNNGSNDACGIASLSLSQTTFGCSEVGNQPETLTVTDNNGNVSTCGTTVTVQDNVAPVALCQNVTVQLNSSGVGTTTASAVDNGSNDACGIASISLSQKTFGCSEVGNQPETLTVTDNNGNVSTCATTINVQDNVAPVAVCQNVTVQLNSSGAGSTTAGAVNNGSSDACGIASVVLSQTSFGCSEVGNQPETLTVTDVNGNVTTCATTVSVQDNVAPVAICQNLTLQLDATGNVSTTPAAVDNGSSDACGIASLALTQTAFVCSEVGNQPETLTVTDVNGNVTTCNTVLTIQDNVAPVAVCQNLTLQLDATGNVSTTPAAVDNGSSDACGIASLALSQTAFVCSEVGDQPETLTVTDVNGNVTTCNTVLTIQDNVAPVAVCQDLTLQLDATGNVSTTPAAVDNGSSDACGIASLVLTQTAFVCAEVGVQPETLTVTDVNGNVTTCNTNLTIQDNVNPTAICQDVTVDLDASGNVSIFAADINNGSNDACGVASTVLDVTAFNCTNVGSGNTVTLTVTDVNSNVSNCTGNVTVRDLVAPVAECQDQTLQLDASGAVTALAANSDNGSSDACNIASRILSKTAFGCSDVGNNNVTLTVTDDNANTGSCLTVITIQDKVNPAANCRNRTVYLDGNGAASVTPVNIDNSSTDACGISTRALDVSSFGCADVGGNTVVLTITDNNGNFSSCSATVTVNDTIQPSASCQDITIQLDSLGADTIVPADINAGASAACGVASTILSKTTFGISDIGSNVVNMTVTDNNANTSSCSTSVTVEDVYPPVAVCQDLTIALDGTGNQTITESAIDNGSSDAAGIATYDTDKTAFACTDVGSEVLTLTVTDNQANTGTCTATITVQDNIAPTANCQNVTFQTDANGNGSVNAVFVNNNSSDACQIASLSLTPSTFTCSEVGANTVVLTVTDIAGNASTCSATATVQDNVAPLAICQDATAYLDGTGNTSITTGDINNGSTDACGGLTYSLDSTAFNCTNTGGNTVTLTVTDVNAQASTCTATVSVIDSIPPVATCPSNMTLNNDAGQCGSAATWTVSTSDNCAGESLAQTAGLASGSFYPVGVTTNNFTVTDASGGTGTCTFTVTVNDTEIPGITCPSDINANNDVNQCSAIVTFTVTTSDNCPGESKNQLTGQASGIAFDVGTTTNLYIVTDASGNTNSCSFNVNVTDNQDPVFTSFPLDKTEGTRADSCGQLVTFGTPLISDNCAGVILSRMDGLSYSSGSFFPEGTTELIFHAIDTSGNFVADTLAITVIDLSAPVLTCPETDTFDATTCGAIVNYAAVTAVDNCTGTVITRLAGQASGSFYGLGTTSHTYRAADSRGNVDFCSFNIVVEDNTAPTITCPASSTVSTDADQCTSVQTWTVATSDNCPNEDLVQTGGLASGSAYPVGTTTNNFVVTDTAGNSAACSFTITVEDNQAPAWTAFPSDLNFNSTNSNCGGNYTFVVTPAGSDNCPGHTITQTAGIPAGGFFPVGSTTNTFRITDASGNFTDTSFVLTVVDNIEPEIVCPADLIFGTTAGQCGRNVNYTVPVGTDNCASVTTTRIAGNNSGDFFPLGATAQTYIVTDAVGKTSSCSFNITIIDVIDPEITCPANITANNDAGQCGAVITWTVTATDNCSGVSFTQIQGLPSGSSYQAGNTTNRFRATDGNGNIDECVFIIHIDDIETPTIDCPNDTVVSTNNNVCTAVVSYPEVTVADNCPNPVRIRLQGIGTGGQFPLGTTTQLFAVRDGSFNSETCSFTVTVEDNQGPTAICNDITVSAAGLGDTTVVDSADIDGGSADGCGTVLFVSLTPNEFTCTQIGDNVVTMTLIDDAANSSTCTGTVTVDVISAQVASGAIEIADGTNGFPTGLTNTDRMGSGVASMGDFDGDGNQDIVVGVPGGDDGGLSGSGEVWITLLNADRTVKSTQVISMSQGGFTGVIKKGDAFGHSVDNAGDINGDGIDDLIIGAPLDDDGGGSRGAVWTVLLNADGTVLDQFEISDRIGVFLPLQNGDQFGYSVAGLGDVDGDGIPDVAVGSPNDNPQSGTAYNDMGAIWIVFLNADGTKKSHQKLNNNTWPGNVQLLAKSDKFGSSLTGLGDVDGDNVPDIAVGAPFRDGANLDEGSVFILLLRGNGTIKGYQEISSTQGNFTGALDKADWFGSAITQINDFDQNGVLDIAVGAPGTDEDPNVTGNNEGGVWILLLEQNRTVKDNFLLAQTTAGFPDLNAIDKAGNALAFLESSDCSGTLAMGAWGNDDGNGNNTSGDEGGVWILDYQSASLSPKNGVNAFALEPGSDEMIIEEFGSNYELSIYPNPNQGQFKLYINGLENEDVSINIVTGMGQSIFNAQYMNIEMTVEETIDLTEMPAGMYYLNMQVGEERITKRVMIAE